ncbi:DNA phosphorothioation system sulfurtransferase DndC [Sulfurimonas sp. C5]|uniref:DNA phosphorothioation system sulfurtransferase DndC n=1 Tax=Sulfurimonas sp. C5 TaxID=3036947 RepID=UPI002455D66A|nr:DNA phosphorothioation system sulfurtransferase DndC [Sulfurimonas sp. C5]MDH4943962.1 DNA phosphorothioation system sulfurtransferase DndC [Sulfurimonas sp. C5]
MNKITLTKQLLKEQYLSDGRPWVVTFSGGKDSSTVLHLTIEVLQELKDEGLDSKTVYIVSSDTGVEMPVIDKYFFDKLEQLRLFIKEKNLNMKVQVVSPEVEDSFWTLLLGKGYPSPNQNFRWCTDRLKITPATRFLTSISNENRSILMLLGVRSDESQTRAESIEKRDRNHRGLVKHDTVPNAFVLSPIKDWTNGEVWQFLMAHKAPWGKHDDMLTLYSKGSGEADCNVALNPEAPSCGKTRFGCWVCTVVSKDKSMENMLQNPEDQWMEPLHKFRNMLEEYRYDHTNRRQTTRRNGQKGVGPFTMSTRQELLKKLLEIEKELLPNLNGKHLISDEEIIQIQKEWLHDGDFFETAISLAQGVGRIIHHESKKAFSVEEREYFSSLCEENSISIELMDKLLQTEHKYRHQLKRSGVLVDIEKVVEAYGTGKINEI